MSYVTNLGRIMYKFEHVLCADFNMSYVNCSPNGLAVWLAASVQRPCVHIHRAQRALKGMGLKRALQGMGPKRALYVLYDFLCVI